MPRLEWTTCTTSVHHYTQALVEIGFCEFFARDGVNLDPPNLCLPSTPTQMSYTLFGDFFFSLNHFNEMV
jgi:hypothetical protein